MPSNTQVPPLFTTVAGSQSVSPERGKCHSCLLLESGAIQPEPHLYPHHIGPVRGQMGGNCQNLPRESGGLAFELQLHNGQAGDDCTFPNASGLSCSSVERRGPFAFALLRNSGKFSTFNDLSETNGLQQIGAHFQGLDFFSRP